MNSNFSGDPDDRTAPDTEQHHRSRFDAAWLIVPIVAALAFDVVAAKTLPVRFTVGWPSTMVMVITSWLAGIVAYGVVSVIEGRRSR